MALPLLDHEIESNSLPDTWSTSFVFPKRDDSSFDFGNRNQNVHLGEQTGVKKVREIVGLSFLTPSFLARH